MQEQSSSISSFRRFVVRILLPLLFVVGAAGWLFNYCFERLVILKSPICGAYKVNRIIHDVHADEIPIFGSSRAEGSFIPDSLGNNYFDYGLSGTGYDVTLFFLQHECEKQKTTPWIILNFDLNGMAYSLGDIANYILNSNDPGVRQLLGKEYKSYFNVPFIKYFGRYENYLGLYLNNKMLLTKITNKGASLEKNVLPESEFNALVEKRRNDAATFANDSLLTQRLFGIISTHPLRRFVFVVAPYHSSCFLRFNNPGDVQTFFNRLTAFSNVKVLDFSRLPLPDSMFLNTTHVNYKGAVVFNRLLRDSLVRLGVK